MRSMSIAFRIFFSHQLTLEENAVGHPWCEPGDVQGVRLPRQVPSLLTQRELLPCFAGELVESSRFEASTDG